MVATVESAGQRFMRPPSSCGTEFAQLQWTGTVAVRLYDDLHLGLRFNSPAVQDAVVAGLGGLVAADVLDPTPYFSVRLGTPGRRKAAPLHYLYLGSRPVLGTRDIARLLRGLGNHLGAHLAGEPEGYVVDAVPVLSPRGMLLVPRAMLAMARAVDRVLLPAGFGFADVPSVAVEPGTATVVVREPLLGLAPGADQVAALGPSLPEPTVVPGRYPLAGWLVHVPAEQAGPLRPAVGVLHTTGLVHPPYPFGAQAALEAMAALTERAPVTGVSWSADEDLVAQVLDFGRA